MTTTHRRTCPYCGPQADEDDPRCIGVPNA